MEWQLVHHPRNVESVQSLSFTGLGYNAHAGTVTIGPGQVMFQIKRILIIWDTPRLAAGS
jgi:hypothetical protein